MVTFQFIPYTEVESLSSAKRVNKLLNIVKENKIVIMEGRLKKEEEADLIEITMEEISSKFKGIELSVVYPNKNKQSSYPSEANPDLSVNKTKLPQLNTKDKLFYYNK